MGNLVILCIFALCILLYVIIKSKSSSIIYKAEAEANSIRTKASSEAQQIICNAEAFYNSKIEEAAVIRSKADSDAQQIIDNAEAFYKAKIEEANNYLSSKKELIAKETTYLNLRIKKVDEDERQLKRLECSIFALPYMSSIIADFDTRGLEILARQLDWGQNIERAKKVTSIRELRKNTKDELAKYKEAQYQLEYALKMFPALADFLETDYRQLGAMNLSDISSEEHDCARDYLSKEEYEQLSTTERNQLALDRYRESHRKTNWQIGRDYELYIGYLFEKDGYSVDYFGSYNGLEDLGRDLIVKKGNETLIVQCKYWASSKTIHENHINQLYGTMVCYCFEHGIPRSNVRAVLVTNISLSDTAKRFAKYLGVTYRENIAFGEYPCIKCNVNRSQYGDVTKIYHLPFDQQYDSCKINSAGEFFAMTVAEAEAAGFRRAYRWHGQ